MKLSLKPVRASRAPGFQGYYGGSQLILTLYPMHFFCFQMCNRLPEMMKNGDAGIFPAYYSLNHHAGTPDKTKTKYTNYDKMSGAVCTVVS